MTNAYFASVSYYVPGQPVTIPPGGQVNLPLVGRPIVPSLYGQRYAIGHVVEGGKHLFVATGIGTSIVPVRFGVPPEVSMLLLHPDAQAGPG